MRFKIDENLPTEIAGLLHNEGHDVVHASEVGQVRADDYEILQKVIADNRILIIRDEHFGDWVMLPLSRHPGVIRLKINPTTSENAIKLLLPFLRLHSSEQFRDHLVILSSKRAKWVYTV